MVRETMGWSKADVFATLLEPDEPPRRPRPRSPRPMRPSSRQAASVEIPGAPRRPADAPPAWRGRCASRQASHPSTRDALLDALGWRGEVDLALSPADVGRGRPAPDMILGAMARLGVRDPAAVVVVGDTASDLEAGRAGRGRGGRRRPEWRPRRGDAPSGAAHGPHRRRDRAAPSCSSRCDPNHTRLTRHFSTKTETCSIIAHGRGRGSAPHEDVTHGRCGAHAPGAGAGRHGPLDHAHPNPWVGCVGRAPTAADPATRAWSSRARPRRRADRTPRWRRWPRPVRPPGAPRST